jgi:hypothetical protein
MAVPTRLPVPSMAGLRIRYRPVLAVQLTGTATAQLRDGLLDTGADDTVFSDAVAFASGLDLSQAERRLISLAGRPQPLLCRYLKVQLKITDGIESFEWPATVGFVAARLHYSLLGQTGFLQFFSADFDGEDHIVTLTPKQCFPGRRTRTDLTDD